MTNLDITSPLKRIYPQAQLAVYIGTSLLTESTSTTRSTNKLTF